jgi:spore maturation protein CgeB
MKVPGGRKCIQAALVRSMQELVSSPPEKDPMKGTVEYLGSAGFEDMAQIFSQSALSFGSIEIASTHVLRNPLLFIRVREFEVAMSGGVHLVNRHPELEEYFEDESEMVYYDSLDELVEKARFYLAPERKTARDKIRAAAVKRAVGEHTWSHRFEGVGKALGIAI